MSFAARADRSVVPPAVRMLLDGSSLMVIRRLPFLTTLASRNSSMITKTPMTDEKTVMLIVYINSLKPFEKKWKYQAIADC
jgi:hypothetical protein